MPNFPGASGDRAAPNVEDLPTTETNKFKTLAPSETVPGGLEWKNNPIGEFFEDDLILTGTEPFNRFLYVGDTTSDLELPLEANISADYAILLENHSSKKDRLVTISTKETDIIIGPIAVSINESALIEQTGTDEFTVTVLSSRTSHDATILGDGTSENPLRIAPKSFAHFYQQDNTDITTINTLNVFEDINCSLSGDLLTNFTVSGNTITYTGTLIINIELHVAAVVDPQDNNQDTILLQAFHDDGVTSTQLNGQSRSRNNTSPLTDSDQVLVLFTVATIEENDTIDLKVANGDNGSDLRVRDITGLIKQI